MVMTEKGYLIRLTHKTNREENGDIERKSTSEKSENEKVIEEQSVEEGSVSSGTPISKEDISLTIEVGDDVKEIVALTESKKEEPVSETPKKYSMSVIAAIVGGIVFLLVICLIITIKNKNRKNDKDIKMTEYPDGQGTSQIVKSIVTAKNSPVSITSIHGVGSRAMQQDSFGISEVNDEKSLGEKGLLAIVADGMGGLEDGDKMSQLVVVTMLQGFDQATGDEKPQDMLLKLLDDANDAVNLELGEERQGLCGSTLVAVHLKNNRLSFISVGDSHIYLYRAGKLVQINHDHNYAADLDEKARNGEISLEEAATNPQRAALTSFIGMGDLEHIDQNDEPIVVKKNDRILLMSDGIYGTIGDENICNAMSNPLKKSAIMINEMILAENRPKQDNYTCILMEII